MRRSATTTRTVSSSRPRDGTPATRLPAGAVHSGRGIAQQRLEARIASSRSTQTEINRVELGRSVEVLVERAARSAGDLLGRMDSNKVVAFPGDEARIGQFTHVLLTTTSGSTFRGEEVHAPAVRVA